jgi:cytoskeleton protein RodZ
MPETIGQRLRKAREDRYLSLEKASEDTRIRRVFLQALESDDYSIIPSAAQGRGFLRNYSSYLGLDIDAMIAEIQKNAPPPEEVVGPLPEVNLVETEIPPLVDADEEPTPHFWPRWFNRRPKTESTAETESTEPAEEETPPVEQEQVEVRDEAKTGILLRLSSLFRSNIEKTDEVESIPEVDIEDEIGEEEQDPSLPILPADAIFEEIGAQLRERRELISLTVEEVEKHTKLRAVFVKALEEGSFEKLPSPVQTRGMLSNYATFLDMDVDVVLLRFADALQARRREKYAETPREKIQTQVNASIPSLRAFIAGDLIFGIVIIALLVALAVWGVGRVMRLQAERGNLVQSTAPAIADVIRDLDTPTPTLDIISLVEGTPSVPEDNGELQSDPGVPVPGAGSNVVVSLFAIERTYVRISVDGEVEFEGRMAPRETKVFEADDQVVVLTGNAAALRVTYNGQDLGLMGGMGEVVIRVYLQAGVVTPTATLPPTPTNTPPVTPTFTPTITPTATPLTD